MCDGPADSGELGVGFAELDRLCTPETRINHGPLNDAFVIEIDGRRVFVRKRVLVDATYGQTFAGERFVPPVLRQHIRVPALLGVIVDEEMRERFAVFAFVSGREPDWSTERTLRDLAEVLASIHRCPARGFGDVGRDPITCSAPDFIQELIEAELGRLPPALEATRLILETLRPTARLVEVLDGETPVHCHGDVHRGNFLTDDGGDLWVLDWEAARFRVAASDFNQMSHRWLKPDQELLVMQEYARQSGRDLRWLTAQIAVLRVLWHLRTFNFQILVKGSAEVTQQHHLVSVLDYVSQLREHHARAASPQL